MTKTYAYRFTVLRKHPGTDGHRESDWYREEIVLIKRVTDRMEERAAHKAGYAAEYFNRVLRSEYGYRNSPVTAARIQEI